MHPNPILDTGLYEVQFEDGCIDTFSANIIAENISEQVDDEGRTTFLMDEIVDHHKTKDAVTATSNEMERSMPNGQQKSGSCVFTGRTHLPAGKD